MFKKPPFFSFCTFLSLIFFTTVALADLDLYEGGATGQWWNPTRAGEGFYVEIINVGGDKQIGVAMYTFDNDGNPLWIVGNVAIQPGDQVKSIPVFRFNGPSWGSNYDPGDLNTVTFGTFTVRFPTCDTALFSIDSDGALESGDWSLQRITSVDGVGCVEPPEPPPPSEPTITPGVWTGPGVCFMVSDDGKSIFGGNLSACDAQAAFDSNLEGVSNEGRECNVTASCEGVWAIENGTFSCVNDLGQMAVGQFSSNSSASGRAFEGEGGKGEYCTGYWEATPN